MDALQRNAIVNILQAVKRPAPYLLIGPGGSGKTKVVAEAALQIYKRNKRARVLLCSYTNCNVDRLAKLVYDSKQVDRNEMIRIFARISNEEASSEIAGLTKKMVDCSAEDHFNYRLVFCTCGYAGAISKIFNNFDYIFIDSDRSKEVSVLATLDLLKESEGVLVLSGNLLFEKPEFPGKNRSQAAIRSLMSNIDRTLQDRLYETVGAYRPINGVFDERLVTFLSKNYRCDKLIVSLLSGLFYKNLLEATQQARDDLLKELNVKSSLVYCPVEGSQTYDSIVHAWHNLDEVMACFKLFNKLTGIGLTEDQISIVCPVGQFFELEKYFEKNNVAKPSKFREEERDVLIISPATSGEADYTWFQDVDKGQLFEPVRFATILSRAKHMVILVGNEEHLRRDPSWARFIELAEKTNVGTLCALANQ